eukprot:5048325-Amphidinium_carterae.1
MICGAVLGFSECKSSSVFTCVQHSQVQVCITTTMKVQYTHTRTHIDRTSLEHKGDTHYCTRNQAAYKRATKSMIRNGLAIYLPQNCTTQLRVRWQYFGLACYFPTDLSNSTLAVLAEVPRGRRDGRSRLRLRCWKNFKFDFEQLRAIPETHP